MKKILFSSLLLTLVVGTGYYFYATLPDVSALKQRNPKTTALIELRTEEYKNKGLRNPRRQFWVPYGTISEHLKKAVLISEDAAFFSHKGVDMDELKAALKKDWETMSFNRGGSTITMQLAKNLYLNPSKNPLRKLKEILIARQLEQNLSKRRIWTQRLRRRGRSALLLRQIRRRSRSAGIGNPGRAAAEPPKFARTKHRQPSKSSFEPFGERRLLKQRRVPTSAPGTAFSKSRRKGARAAPSGLTTQRFFGERVHRLVFRYV
jgi:Transglycosylase